mmetsp:Transcript_92525/g.258661  ORF Transcript_92525/g.258661 Transcript_92525/m.258661 type:complete len:182 (-) Transcript_92525:142-687(-)
MADFVGDMALGVPMHVLLGTTVVAMAQCVTKDTKVTNASAPLGEPLFIDDFDVPPGLPAPPGLANDDSSNTSGSNDDLPLLSLRQRADANSSTLVSPWRTVPDCGGDGASEEEEHVDRATDGIGFAASWGSFGHPKLCAGPCKYFGKPRGCKDGAACARCHVCRWGRWCQKPQKTRQGAKA